MVAAQLLWTAQFEADLQYAQSTKADLQYAHSIKADLEHAHCHASEGACPGIHTTIEISKDGSARLHSGEFLMGVLGQC